MRAVITFHLRVGLSSNTESANQVLYMYNWTIDLACRTSSEGAPLYETLLALAQLITVHDDNYVPLPGRCQGITVVH